MSSAARVTRPATPLLADWMRLTQPEYHRRYGQYPDDVKFELIGGVVAMASPLLRDNGTSHPEIVTVFVNYKARTPGVEVANNMTVLLGFDSEPQPDVMLRILTKFGGQSRYDEYGYLVGAPELVCEVAHSSQTLDLGRKLEVYERYGVKEYDVYDSKARVVHWRRLPGRAKLLPDRSGVYKSDVFPGLWLDSKALARGDSAALIAAVEKGTRTAAQKKFVAKLDAAKQP